MLINTKLPLKSCCNQYICLLVWVLLEVVTLTCIISYLMWFWWLGDKPSTMYMENQAITFGLWWSAMVWNIVTSIFTLKHRISQWDINVCITMCALHIRMWIIILLYFNLMRYFLFKSWEYSFVILFYFLDIKFLNPLHPNISTGMHILLTVLHTLP